jgi:hypothetical protein
LGISSASDVPVVWEKPEEESANYQAGMGRNGVLTEACGEAFCSRDGSRTVVIGVSMKTLLRK